MTHKQMFYVLINFEIFEHFYLAVAAAVLLIMCAVLCVYVQVWKFVYLTY